MLRVKALSVAELDRINQVTADRALRVQDVLARAAILAADHERTKRLEARQCRCCYYVRKLTAIVGHGFTKWKCTLCPAEGQHHNTGTPRVCDECSDGFQLCVMCGGDIEMRRKSKFERKWRKKRG